MNRSILYAIARHDDGAEMALDLLDPFTRAYLATAPLPEYEEGEIALEWAPLEIIAFAAMIIALHPLAAIALYAEILPLSVSVR